MILEFKTKGNNAYHRRKYLWIDTEKKEYSTEPTGFVIEGIEISTADYKELLERCKKENYTFW